MPYPEARDWPFANSDTQHVVLGYSHAVPDGT
jgi:hypothetical protein